MLIQIKFVGIFFIILALVHVIFPRYFKWDEELKSLSLINREMTYVHTFFIALMVFLMGLLCLFCANDLAETPLGRRIAGGLCFFWACRWVMQFWGYSAANWRGKTFETCIHILFSILWTYLVWLFASVAGFPYF